MANWTYRWPQDIMEALQELHWYGQKEEAWSKLLLVAEHVDNPDKLKQLEEEWLYGPKKSKPYYSGWGGNYFGVDW